MTTHDLITKVIARIGHGFRVEISSVNGRADDHCYTVLWTRRLFCGDDLTERDVSAGTLDYALQRVLAVEDERDARLREVFGVGAPVEELT